VTAQPISSIERCGTRVAIVLRGWLGVLAVLLTSLLSAACLTPTTTGSIGAVLSRDNVTGAVHVRESPPGLAADSAGIVAGDRVKMVDGVLVDDIDAGRIRRLLRGPVGSTVTLTLVRGDEVMHIEVTRQPLGAGTALPERHERIE
jgi:S1-C subfamily serine protease